MEVFREVARHYHVFIDLLRLSVDADAAAQELKFLESKGTKGAAIRNKVNQKVWNSRRSRKRHVSEIIVRELNEADELQGGKIQELRQSGFGIARIQGLAYPTHLFDRRRCRIQRRTYAITIFQNMSS
jgi:hypothetical protein